MSIDKIIIDGCDVSGCEFYNKDDKTCREVNGKYDTEICDFDKCEGSNCYFKQLQHEKEYRIADATLLNERLERITELEETLSRKEQEYEKLSSLIRETETYSDVCCECRDEILTYPTIAGRTDYTQIEVEERSLKKIIRQLDQLKKENDVLFKAIEEVNKINKRLESKNEELTSKCSQLKQTLTEIKEIVFPKNQLIITDSPIILKIQEKSARLQLNNNNSQICPNCITWASKYAKLKFEHKELIKKYLALEEKLKK